MNLSSDVVVNLEKIEEGPSLNGSSGKNTTSSTELPDNDYWLGKNICDYLDNITDIEVRITCGTDLYLPPFLFVFGVISNIFVIIVMRSKAFRSISTSFYMTANAVTDTASLLINLPVHYIFVNFHQVFRNAMHAHYMCSFFNVLGWGSSDLGILFTVAMTTERAIAIRYPLKAYQLCTPRRAMMVVMGLTLFELLKLSHMAYKSRVVANTTSRLCDLNTDNPDYANFVEYIWPWIHVSILVVSYVLVMAGNVVILVNIKKSSNATATNGVGRKTVGKESRSAAKNRQLSIMLVLDSCCLIACTLPYGIVIILTTRFPVLKDSLGGKNLAYTSTFYLLYINRCLNFLLYCISGARFREAIKNMFLHPSTLLNSDGTIKRENRSERKESINRARGEGDRVTAKNRPSPLSRDGRREVEENLGISSQDVSRVVSARHLKAVEGYGDSNLGTHSYQSSGMTNMSFVPEMDDPRPGEYPDKGDDSISTKPIFTISTYNSLNNNIEDRNFI